MLHNNILKIRDESNHGEIYNELELRFDRVKVSVRDIITERVYQEVIKYNNQASEYHHALVKPQQTEVLLNNKKSKFRPVNAEKQVAVALQAFQSNGFFILVDDLQADDLEQMITIKPETIVSFIKLTPLVGG